MVSCRSSHARSEWLLRVGGHTVIVVNGDSDCKQFGEKVELVMQLDVIVGGQCQWLETLPVVGHT